jgi:hypothetical protein
MNNLIKVKLDCRGFGAAILTWVKVAPTAIS